MSNQYQYGPSALKSSPLTQRLRILVYGACASGLLLALSVLGAASPSVQVDGKDIRLEFDSSLHCRVIATFDGKEVALGPYDASETISVDDGELRDFALKSSNGRAVRDELGAGRQVSVIGTSGQVLKTLTATTYDEFPRMIFLKVRYTNQGTSELKVTGWTNNRYSIAPDEGVGEPAFWSYQSGSYERRPDWVLPLKAGFKQENYLGMNATDYGGGTPVVDIWRRNIGMAVGHIETVAKLVSLPVTMPDAGHATLELRFRTTQVLKPGAALETFRSFVAVHRGDYFETLKSYGAVMQKQGLKIAPSPPSAFEPIWCAWGYGRTFTPKQVEGALPAVKKLGFGWVGVDDGWQSSDGDWGLVATKFPGGDADMKALVDKIHAQGFRAQIWWAPLAVKPTAQLAIEHPEQLLLNADGSKQKISYWNDWYLCPADPAVLEYHKKLVLKMIKEWGFDGLKLDGQHMNGVPACHNPAHKHARPEDSVEGLAHFFQMIFDTARSVKPDALVEWCPCGTAYNFYTLPHLNMSVASDPGNSWQVRSKGKTLKALHGDALAYFGDHVELSDGRQDFASTVGVGGVVGTQFTWPGGSGRNNRLDLTPEKEPVWQKWIALYNEKRLSQGEYRGELYDIGFDRPEAHAIRKAGSMYYAFFAPQWQGKIELRGLERRLYTVRDYENGKTLGKVQGPKDTIDAQFQKHLLLEVKPE